MQLQMAPTEAAEFAAKLQDATQTTEKDMMSLMDLIQRGFYAGVDPGNMLQGFANISSAMDIIKQKGLDAAKPSVRFSSWPIRRGWLESQRVMPTVKFFRPRWMRKY